MSAWDRRPMFALDADVTVYWPAVRPCWEERTPEPNPLAYGNRCPECGTFLDKPERPCPMGCAR